MVHRPRQPPRYCGRSHLRRGSSTEWSGALATHAPRAGRARPPKSRGNDTSLRGDPTCPPPNITRRWRALSTNERFTPCDSPSSVRPVRPGHAWSPTPSRPDTRVTAVVRDPKRLNLPPNEHLRVVTADVMDPANIVPAVADADVVVSALGPPSKGPTTVLQDSTRSIIEAMEKSRTRRLVTTVSGSMVDDSGDGAFMHYLAKPMTRRILKNVCSDMRRAESEIHASGLDWTNLPSTPTYRQARDGVSNGNRSQREARPHNLQSRSGQGGL